jgi:hypothetical protein
MGTRPSPVSYIFIHFISLSKQELSRSLPLLIRKIRQKMRDKRRRGKRATVEARDTLLSYIQMVLNVRKRT